MHQLLKPVTSILHSWGSMTRVVLHVASLQKQWCYSWMLHSQQSYKYYLRVDIPKKLSSICYTTSYNLVMLLITRYLILLRGTL